MFKKMSLFFKAMADFNKFFDEGNKNARTLVFYSERGIYLRYYEGLIHQILERSDLNICYLTADENDPIFKFNNSRVKPYYIHNFEASLFPGLDSKVIIMTLPDLNNFYIKKTTNPQVNHVYAFHAIGSTHLQYNFGAFDHYDTILCVGRHHDEEVRKNEEIYHLKPKTLVKFGYPYLEKIFQEHQAYKSKYHKAKDSKKVVLIAPTWGENCILETCIYDIINRLKNTNYDIYIRPHPEFIKRRGRVVDRIKRAVNDISNINLELDLVSGVNVHNADILITDWSGIAFEYAFGTERPVLFIDTPLKIDNKRYSELAIEPLEVFSRNMIGKSITLSEIDKINEIISSFITGNDMYRLKIIEFRNRYIYNWMNSAAIGADYIITLCDGNYNQQVIENNF